MVVVDDSVVRGTTSRKLVALLRRSGVREVHMRVASPPITGPCYYGIDTPRKEELIAARRPLEGIQAWLGVDSLGYLSEAGLRASVRAPGDHCYACFTGRYPVALRGEDLHHEVDADRVGPPRVGAKV